MSQGRPGRQTSRDQRLNKDAPFDPRQFPVKPEKLNRYAKGLLQSGVLEERAKELQMEIDNPQNYVVAIRETSTGAQKKDNVGSRLLRQLNGESDEFTQIFADNSFQNDPEGDRGFIGKVFKNYKELEQVIVNENVILQNPAYSIRDGYDVVKNVVASRQPCMLHSELKAAMIPGNKNGLVFLITSSGNKHAIIAIALEGKVYTVGFGYYGGNKVGVKHTVEVIPGAMYTADYLMPNENQTAKISWIGYLNNTILSNLEKKLQNVTEILYKVEPDERELVVTNECVLTISEEAIKYTEMSSALPKYAREYSNYYNCITWAKEILGVEGLDCGLVDNPANCVGLDEADGQKLSGILRIRDPHVYNTQMKKFIEEIQYKFIRKMPESERLAKQGLAPSASASAWGALGSNASKVWGMVTGPRGGKKTKKRNHKKQKKSNRKTSNRKTSNRKISNRKTSNRKISNRNKK
jgi:hypothetical protein